MRSLKVFALVSVSVLVASLTFPAELLAQRHRPHGRARVVVSAGYFPYYSPYHWGAFYGSPFWGPWPPHPYAYYGAYRYASEVRIQTTPREAEVYVDGYLVGTVDDFDGWSQRLRLRPGEHEIELFLEGHRPFREKNLYRPGVTYRIRAALEKAGPDDPPATRPRPQPGSGASETPAAREWPRGERRGAFGTLVVRTQPADAVVIVDGERWDRPAGDAQLSLQLSAGSHEVEVRLDGHRPYLSTVEVRPGEVTSLNVSLPAEP